MSEYTGFRRVIAGRGAASNPAGRFAICRSEPTAEACAEQDAAPGPPTELRDEFVAGIVSRNASPDVPFDQSINPYRGCEHGCIYCYARPSHSFLDLSPGIDFETRIMVKVNAVERLRERLASRRYRCKPITLGANTDPYQPAEKSRGITRGLVGLLAESRHPFSIITKSALIERDIELLGRAARRRLCSVAISIPTLDDGMKRRLEPRVPSAARRLQTIRRLTDAGIPVTLMLAPVIPALTDHELEDVLAAASMAGAERAVYVLLRLPHEVSPLFREWLEAHYPERAARVMSLVRQYSGGRDYDPAWGRRQRGSGEYARLIASRFRLASRRHGLDRPGCELDCTQFRRPGDGGQLSLTL